jgi:hypothetical protein
MRRLKSVDQAQRFLSTLDAINNRVDLRLGHVTSVLYRAA